MSRAKSNPWFVWHCSAGFAGVESIEAYWGNPKSKGGLGWNSKGYCVIIDMDGTIWWLHSNTNKVGGYRKEYNPKCWEFVTNGVAGFNSKIVNACTIGGIENTGTKQKPIWKSKDTRTEAQKKAQYEVMNLYFEWLKENGGDYKAVQIDGHYNYSTDSNRNGKIDKWERIKECPSYDANEEFRWLTKSATNPGNKLPNKK